ncbi:hypothetical protein [Aeromicrobium sp. P5_D10]
MQQVLKVLPWVVAVVAVCAVVAGIIQGSAGALGALFGGGLVCVFFSSSPFALGPITKVSPQLSLLVAMMFFVTKVVALLALFTVLADSDRAGDRLDPKSLAGTVIVATLAWTYFQIRAAKRQRLPMYDLGNDAP